MGRVVIIGAGIAGVSTAAALARRGVSVALFERDRLAGTGSTGRNAAIFRLAVAEAENVELALRARDLGARLVKGGTVARTGAFYRCPDEATREAILRASGRAGVREARRDELPAPLRSASGPTVYSPEDGVIDVHSLVQALVSQAKEHGATLRFGAAVEGLDLEGGAVRGVVVDGARVEAETVVDATGPWSPTLPGARESDVGIRPHRRHLFLLEPSAQPGFSCVVWDLAAGFYLRPESGALLASACDETEMEATEVTPTDPEVASVLFEKLQAADPSLASAGVRRCWAGLRPLTSDHRFVVGPDPTLPGLFRVGGFGGHGMTAGAAAGELAAALLCGEHPSLAPSLDPGRPGLLRGR